MKNTKTQKRRKAGVILAIVTFLVFMSLLYLIDSSLREIRLLNEELLIVCEISNKQQELLVEIYPYYSESSCNAFKEILKNETASDYLCMNLKNIKIPDKLDCEGLK